MNASSTFDLSSYLDFGFSPPIDLLSERECKKLVGFSKNVPRRLDWHKGLAVSSPTISKIAHNKVVTDLVSKILGENIILWGAIFVRRAPGRKHQWHTDIETHDKIGSSVCVWIALENVNINSSLKIISCSHKLGNCIQKVAKDKGIKRDEINDESAEQWAKEFDPDCELVQTSVRDGQAILFDGSIWHASHNTNLAGTRTALLLQYASADTPIRLFNTSKLEWPFEFEEHPRPPCLQIRGRTPENVNRIESPRNWEKSKILNRISFSNLPRLTSWIRHLPFPLEGDKDKGWKPHQIFRRNTEILKFINCHVSVLNPGKCPHIPHHHAEEEILIMLSGEADLVLKGFKNSNSESRVRLKPGSLIYYPANYIHTIENPADSPATYLMFKWRNLFYIPGISHNDKKVVDFSSHLASSDADQTRRFKASRLFEFPTRYLGKLHCHFSTMLPGGGYEPHSDNYDVAIIVLSGELETLGTLVRPHDLIYYAAGQMHGLKNHGPEPAKYIVFEFHKRNYIPSPRSMMKRIGKLFR